MGDSDQQLKSDALLEQMKTHLTTDAGKEIIDKVGFVYQLHIAPKKIGFNEVIYTVDLKKGEVKKGAYEGGKPDATFSFKDEDFVKIATGKMNPQIAFMRGALKIKGSFSAAQKFTPDIFPKPSKIIFPFSGNSPQTSLQHIIEHNMGDSDQQLKSDAWLELMKTYLTTDAGKGIIDKVGFVYQLHIAPKKIGFNEVIYTVDLKKGEVKKGAYEGGKPDAMISLKDEDFVKIATGKMNPQIAFMRGALKVKGSFSAAQKFTPELFPKPSKM
ncbi:Peroxisomal multifunctional enzyme type 2 [Bienertia sinuspersici]